MRGSRLVGLLSMIITRVLGSGLLAQERVKARHAAQARARNIFSEVKSRHRVRRLVSARQRASIFARDDNSSCFPSGIGDLPQYRWALCTGSGGNIRRAPVPGLVRHEREGGGFFGFGR